MIKINSNTSLLIWFTLSPLTHTTAEAKMNTDTQLNGIQSRRMAAQDRFLSRIEKREAKAEKMIGELSSGRFYVFPVGGKYREGSKVDLISFLIRNNYA